MKPQQARRLGLGAGPPLHPTHYEVLGLAESADEAAVSAAIAAARAAAAEGVDAAAAPAAAAGLADASRTPTPHPPDTTRRDPALAAAVLGDPTRRAVYDRYLARERGQSPAEPKANGRPAASPRQRRLVMASIAGGLVSIGLWLLLPRDGTDAPGEGATAVRPAASASAWVASSPTVAPSNGTAPMASMAAAGQSASAASAVTTLSPPPAR
jgi:hypothetical protein